MQFTEDENSRSYLDFDSINDALDGKIVMMMIYVFRDVPDIRAEVEDNEF